MLIALGLSGLCGRSVAVLEGASSSFALRSASSRGFVIVFALEASLYVTV